MDYLTGEKNYGMNFLTYFKSIELNVKFNIKNLYTDLVVLLRDKEMISRVYLIYSN